MPDIVAIRGLLQQFDFKALFREQLGWDTLVEPPLRISITGEIYTLAPVAQKRGVRVLRCGPDAAGQIPPATIRLQISQEVTKRSAEHLLVFVDAAEHEQTWLWVRREGSQVRPRTFSWHHHQAGDALASRLASLEVSIDEEMTLLQPHVAGKLKNAFDVEKVTKKFYDAFKTRHDAFMATIQGIPVGHDREWYASLMLNRLMFVYFIQFKGFLAGDVNYLRTRLDRITRNYPPDAPTFYTFYRQFLLRLFHEGLGQRNRSPELTMLLGDVPYLNGGLFDVHELEQTYPAIVIPDDAFRQIFDFFDQYQWHLDERPSRLGNEINPDVLGFIFEKYINNKQMGAYYTKEDITEYIGKSTIIPFIFDRAAQDYPAGFNPDGPVWSLLRENPGRYIYPAVRYGMDQTIPPEIEAGLTTIVDRGSWNKSAAPGYGLATETWREYIERHQRYHALHALLERGGITTVADLITHNLNIRQFASDVLAYTTDPQTLRVLFTSIQDVTICDPTSGSGAFLFGALGLLEPLYEACLERMNGFVEDHQRGQALVDDTLNAFQMVLTEANDRQRHPSRRYFILKSIMLKNLYGVDIMEEAVEICKLRLFLKLVAQAETSQQLEPLPDIDFNIRAGNSLVGYATYDQVATMLDAKMDVHDTKAAIKAAAQKVRDAYHAFREAQRSPESDPVAIAEQKQVLRDQLSSLNDLLNTHLVQDYPVRVEDRGKVDEWLKTHSPFHWFVEFYDIVEGQGGFDVIIGNPPYVGYSKVRGEYTVRGYTTEPCNNLYALTIERSLMLLKEGSYLGMIVPIASISTTGMTELQTLYQQFPTWHSNFAVRPGKLFVGVDMNLTITLLHHTTSRDQTHTTGYYRWFDSQPSNRPVLFENLYYAPKPELKQMTNPFPKLGSFLEYSLLQKMLSHNAKLGRYSVPHGESIYYHSGGRYWRKAIPSKLSSHYKPVTVAAQYLPIVGALLNSQLFYWYWISNSNCMDVVSREVLELPVFRFEGAAVDAFAKLYDQLMESYFASNTTRQRRGDLINVDEVNFDVGRSKPIIDAIDQLLAQHYGFSGEELDFILNYDIKYRMGQDAD